MALPSFAVTGNLKEILGVVVSSELTASAMSQAVVEFVSNYPATRLIRFNGVMHRMPTAPPSRVNTNGDIVDDDGEQVRLLAQDDGLSIRHLQWQVRITIPAQVIPPSPSGQIKAWWIDAGIDGDNVNLETTLPAVETPYKIITQGPAGPGVNGVTLDEFGRVVFTVDGVPIPSPLDLVIYDLTAIDGGDAFGTGIIVIDGGDA